jgi:hypothetical protein
MGKMKDGNITGLVGTVVFYTMRGENYMRSKPGKKGKRSKTSAPLKAQRSLFGTVSHYGSPMISVVAENLGMKFDTSISNGIRGWMCKAFLIDPALSPLNNTNYHRGICQLNSACDLRDVLYIMPQIKNESKGKLSVSFPPFNPAEVLRAPEGANSVRIKLLAVHSGFGKKNVDMNLMECKWEMPYKNALQTPEPITFSFGKEHGDHVMLVLAVEFEGRFGRIREKAWQPAAAMAFGRVI